LVNVPLSESPYIHCPIYLERLGTNSEIIKVGKLEIKYLIDGTANGGMGVFELLVPPVSNVPAT